MQIYTNKDEPACRQAGLSKGKRSACPKVLKCLMMDKMAYNE